MRDVVAEEIREVEISGVAESDIGTFTIQANAKAFKILISNLYADKPRAIVRELWSNAFDSHTVAGCPEKPFFCHLPTVFEQHFAVRDFGTSLSHEQIMGLYTTVFASTKGDDNVTVGKFGLGSKTPFSYTDAMTVTAWLDGEQRIYNAFMDASGVPRIALFARGPSEEPTGFEIAFPVLSKDIEAFIVAARRVMLGFTIQPDNNVGLKLPEMKVTLSADDWQILVPNEALALDRPHVRQGCVLYPIDMQALGDGAVCRALAREILILNLPIGSVDITPSRESMSYDDTTKRNILAVLERVYEGMTVEMQTRMEAAPSLHAAIILKRGMLGSIQRDGMRQALEKKLTWRGRRVSNCIRLYSGRLNSIAKRGLTLHGLNRDSSRSKIRWSQTPADQLLTADSGCGYGGRYLPIIMTYKGTIPPKHFSERVTTAVTSRGGQGVVLVASNFNKDCLGYKALWASCGRPEDFDSWFVDLDDIQFEKPDYSKTLAELLIWNNGWLTPCAAWPTPTPDQKNVYWVKTSHDTVLVNDACFDRHQFSHAWDALKRIAALPKDAVLVRLPVSRKDLLRNVPPAWQPIETLIKTATSKWSAESALILEKSRKLASNDYRAYQRVERFTSVSKCVCAYVDKQSGLHAFHKDVLTLNGEAKQEDHLGMMPFVKTIMSADEFEALLKANESKKTVTSVMREAFTAYPLLKRFSSGNDGGSLDRDEALELASYVDFIDHGKALFATTSQISSLDTTSLQS